MGSRQGHDNWDEQYAVDVPPPWEIGGPQPALAALVGRISLEGPVLDAGCGTGELAILIAERGHQVVGLDCSRRAIDTARTKAADSALDIEFLVGDAERLEDLPVRPRTVFDSGLLHNLDEGGRRAYLRGLTAICAPGAVVHILAVADEAGPGWDLTPKALNQLFPAPHWVDTTVDTADVLANVDGEELHLPAFLLSTRRAT
jgi:SAM-dependent methyltransferase